MGHLHPGPREPADAHRLVHGFEELTLLVADVRGVEAAALRHHPGQGHDLAGRGVATRRVLEAGGETERSVVQGLLQDAHHRLHLVGSGGAVGRTHHAFAQRALAHEQGLVHREARALEAGEVGSHVVPVEGDLVPLQIAACLLEGDPRRGAPPRTRSCR